MPPRSNGICIKKDNAAEKDERDEVGDLLIAQDCLFSGAVD